MGFLDVSLLVAALTTVLIYSLSTLDLHLLDVTADSVATSKFISPLHLGVIRLTFAAVAIITTGILSTDSKGLVLTLPLSTGKLKTITLMYTQRLMTFTVWCWMALGLYFLMAGICSILIVYRPELIESQSALLCIASILFEIAFSMAYLVTTVVTFLLIPGARARNSEESFFATIPLILHNANALFMAVEIFLNRIEFRLAHLPFIQLFGLCYVFFTWIHVHRKFEVFFYFFLDYNRPFAAAWYGALFFLVRKQIIQFNITVIPSLIWLL
jgi:hypothetical protein